MGYYEAVLSALPYTAFELNSGNTAYVDLTGRGNTFTGTVVPTNSILAASNKSHLLINGTSVNISTSLFKKGMEQNAFSLAAWFAPLNAVTTMSILSHNTIYDGLAFDGDFIKFSVNLTGGMVTAKWAVPDIMEAYFAVGVYTPDKIQLWINAEMVAEAAMPEAVAFVQEATTPLYAGQSPLTTGKAVIDGIAIFSRALESVHIKRLFAHGRDTQSVYEIPQQVGGSTIDFTQRSEYPRFNFGGSNGWTASALLTNTSDNNGELVPLYDQTTLLSLAGTWYSSLPIAAFGTSNIYGIRAEWNGDGNYTVQASLNGGSSWITLTNGKLITGTFNYSPTDKVVDIRITFTGGVSNDPSVVRDIKFNTFSDALVYAVPNTHTITLADGGTTNPEPNQVIERNLEMGLDLTGTTHTLSAPLTSTPVTISAVQIQFYWSGVSAGTTGYLIDSRATNAGYLLITDTTGVITWAGMSAVYINGVLATSGSVTLKKNEQYDIIAVYTTPLNSASSIGSGNLVGQISLINLYPTAPNAATAALLYSQYFTRPTLAITDEALMTLFEPATPFNVYSLDWAVTSGG